MCVYYARCQHIMVEKGAGTAFIHFTMIEDGLTRSTNQQKCQISKIINPAPSDLITAFNVQGIAQYEYTKCYK